LEYNDTLLDHFLVRPVLAADLPFKFVDRDEFRQFLKFLNKDAKMPSSDTFRRKLAKKYNVACDTLKVVGCDLWKHVKRSRN
jgi:hypothetical protein